MVTSFPLFQLLRSKSESTSLNIGYTYGPSAKLSTVSRMLPVSTGNIFFEGGGLWKVLTVCHNKNNQGHRGVAFRQEICYRKSVR